MTFRKLLDFARKYLEVVESRDEGYAYTQLVIGEMHFLPRVQCELLNTLNSLRKKLAIQLIGKEGLPIKPVLVPIDLKRAADDAKYMQELLTQKINAVAIFNNAYPEVRVEAVDDPHLHELSGYIDRRCHELFVLKQAVGWKGMTEDEKIQYNYWFSLLKNVLLGDRSDFMVRNFYALQSRLDISLAVLICGAAHTPHREEYGPYSVARMLRALPVNYIIAVPPSVLTCRVKKDPFDFYSPRDETEVNPYNTSTQ